MEVININNAQGLLFYEPSLQLFPFLGKGGLHFDMSMCILQYLLDLYSSKLQVDQVPLSSTLGSQL